MAKFDPKQYLTPARKGGPADYLQVKYRLVWFREEWPEGVIVSEHIELSDTHAVFRATATKVDAEGKTLGSATGYGSETRQDFKDFVEKAETKAIGRALAALGYGTQFAPELDEGERIVDSPVERPQPARNAPKPANATPITSATHSPGMRRIHAVGNKFGFTHDELRDLCDREERLANQRGIASMSDAPEALLEYVAALIEKNPENQRKWLDQRAKARQELMPTPAELPTPNPSRFTN